MHRLTTVSLLLMFVATGCYTHYRAPGAVGKVVDAQSGAPVRGVRITRPGLPAATVPTDKAGAFDLSPDSRTQIRFMYLRNPESLTGSFLVSADGYATNELHGMATSRTFWRVQLGKIALQRP